MFTVSEINAAIQQGRTVTARAADTTRRGQPNREAEVTLTEAFSEISDGRIRATARGYRGRFAVADVTIEGLDYDRYPDTF